MPASSKSLADVRAEVCDTVYKWILPLAGIAVASSLLRIFEQGWLPIMSLHIGILVVLTIAYVSRTHIRYTFRAGLLVVLMFLVGIGGHMAFGSPTAVVYFISAAIMAAVFFGERIGIFFVGLSALTILAIYGVFTAGILPPPRPQPGPLVFTTWLANTAAALVSSIGPLISISRFRRYLDAERLRAEAASTAKSNFLATMSHELRTPMTAVLGITDLLLAENLPPSQTEKVERIAKSGHLLLSLLNDLLDFSKIEAGRLTLEHIPFSLNELIGEARDLMAPLAAEKNLKFEIDCAPDMVDALIGDPTCLRQVVMNLLGNAIKFTRHGHVSVRVSQRATPKDSITLHIQVIDTGIGIAPEQQAELFEPFAQADRGISRRFGGTGLGLTISRKLVELMGGEIAVWSRAGDGATFSVTVPVDRDYGTNGARPQTRKSPVASTPPMKVLVTDDNETTRYLLKEMLERWGHTVRLAEDGTVALQAVEDEPFDMILMDMQMPVLDGVGATRAIRAYPGAAARIPILALTADVVPANRVVYLEAGADALVAKPVNWGELAAAMHRWAPIWRGTSASGGIPNTPPDPAPAATKQELSDTLFDKSAVMELAELIDRNALADLLEKSRINIMRYGSDILAAAGKGDAAEVKRLAHTVKGLCLQFGAVRAARCAAALEKSAPNTDTLLPEAETLAEVLAETCAAFKDFQLPAPAL